MHVFIYSMYSLEKCLSLPTWYYPTPMSGHGSFNTDKVSFNHLSSIFWNIFLVNLKSVVTIKLKNTFCNDESGRIKKKETVLSTIMIKVALSLCFALKSWKEYLHLFIYLITLGKDVNFPLITKFKIFTGLRISVNRIPN